MDLGLKGKRALVTGASKGIGLAVAHSLAAEGCRLDIAGRGVAALEQARDALRKAAPAVLQATGTIALPRNDRARQPHSAPLAPGDP